MSEVKQSLVGLVGDVMVRSPSVQQQLSLNPGFKASMDAFNENALRLINLEMPLSRRGYKVPNKYSNLRSDPDIIEDIKLLEPDAVTLANNHMMDFGPDALRDTLAICESAGILVAGAGLDLDHAMRPVILKSCDHSVGLIAVATTLPMESDASEGKPGIAPIRVKFSFELDTNLTIEQPGMMPIVRTSVEADDLTRLTEAIRSLREKVDLVIVSIHWGVPPFWLSPSQGLLAEYQQPLGHAMIDAGADIIWGHHSHVLHPIEVYKGKPIFYSLANYIFEGPKSFMDAESLIVNVTSISPLKVQLTPIWVNDEGYPELAENEIADAVFDCLFRISEEFNTEFSRTGDRVELVLE